MHHRQVKILATGQYLPRKLVTSASLDDKLNKAKGWVQHKSGIQQRHFVERETATDMAVYATQQAIHHAQLTLADIDCIVSANGTTVQAIPCSAALLKHQLQLHDSPIPAFDINSTCLSFITAIDVLSYLLAAQRYRTILVVSSDVASVGLNWHDLESSIILGDGAAAAIITSTPIDEDSQIIASHMETYSQGAHFCEIKAGGSQYHPTHYPDNVIPEKDYLFQMRGKALYKLVTTHLPNFIENLLEKAHISLEDIDLVIPHQASQLALRYLTETIKVPPEKVMNIYADHGNQIAASIPTTLHEAIVQQKIQRGDIVMLLGTAAGVSIGGIILTY